MLARHPQKKRRLPNSNKSDSMVNDNEIKREFLNRLLRNPPQLMFGHFPMRLVFDAVDSAPVLRTANNPKKIDDRASTKISIIRWRCELRFR